MCEAFAQSNHRGVAAGELELHGLAHLDCLRGFWLCGWIGSDFSAAT